MANESLPNSDDVQSNGQTEQELLDAVMKNSPLMQESGVEPLPEEENLEVDPATSETEDPVEEPEEVVSEEEEVTEEPEEEAEGEDATEEVPTQEPEVYSADDLDLDAKVKVKIDGEETEVSFGDLVKGYQTDAHLSKKGRELGEARKEIEAEKEKQLGDLTNISQAANALLGSEEQSLAKEYHELEASIEKARKDGDTFEMGELKDKREQTQKKYWDARNKREGLMKAVQDQQAKAQEEKWKQDLDNFAKEIPNHIPDFNEKIAGDIRNFAIDDLGLDPNILNTIIDPKIVKALNDFRILKNNVAKGTAKRKVIPAKKALPSKKAAPASKKVEDKAKMVKARAFKEDASAEDQMAFLRQHASNSLNNI